MTVYTDVKKDGNSVSVLCGKSDLDGSVLPIQIDPVTGRILVEIHVVADESGLFFSGRAAKDGNSVATILGVADDASNLIVPAIDHRNGLVFCDLING